MRHDPFEHLQVAPHPGGGVVASMNVSAAGLSTRYARGSRDFGSAGNLHPAGTRLVHASFESPTAAQASGLARHRERVRTCSSPARPARARRSAAFLWGLRPARRRARPRAAGLRLAAEGALLRHREEPARSAARDRRRDLRRHPHRRHAPEGAPGDAAHAAGRADHHARVALPDADLEGARVPRRGGLGDRRRDPRRGAHQARRAPRADARAARAGRRQAAPADRPVGHAATARGGRPLPGRRRARVQDRRRRGPQAARPAHPGAGRGHERAGRPRRHRRRRRRPGHRRGRRRPDRRPGSATRPPRSARSGRRSTPSCSS